MNTFRIEYERFSRLFYFGSVRKRVKTISGKFASSWSDITKRELIHICEVLKSTEISVEEGYWLFSKLCKNKRVPKLLTPSEMFPYITWITEETINLDKSLYHRYWWVFKGPKSGLSNLKTNQFGLVQDLLNAVKVSNIIYNPRVDGLKFNSLDMFVGLLYRPRLMPFNKHMVEIWAFFAMFLPLKHKRAMLMNYIGLCSRMYENFPLSFPMAKRKNKPKVDDPFGFEGVILSASGGKFGNYKETGNINLLTFLKDAEMTLSKQQKHG